MVSRFLSRILKGFFLGFVCVFLCGLAYLTYIYVSLPDPANLQKVNPQTTQFIQRVCKGDNACEIDWVPLEHISPFLIQSVVLAEDPRFFDHNGWDWENIYRAAKVNLEHGAIVWGGSSITMQLAKNIYLSPKKNIARKIREQILTFELERHLSKERILEIYLNVAQWGPRLFGVKKAARAYFEKYPDQLGPLEASYLASILPNPEKALDEQWRRHFNEVGSRIFEHLIYSYLPQESTAPLEGQCQIALNMEDRAKLDYLVVKIFSHYAPQINDGRFHLMTEKDLKLFLEDFEWAYVERLFAAVRSLRQLPSPSCRTQLGEDELLPIKVDRGGGQVEHYIPKSSYDALNKLMEKAHDQKIPLRLTSAYRGGGFQTYLFLVTLRQLGYCVDLAARQVALPDESQHSCVEGAAFDFGSDEWGAFGDSKAYEWLLENAPALGFEQTYLKDDFMVFEPWHWYQNEKKSHQ